MCSRPNSVEFSAPTDFKMLALLFDSSDHLFMETASIMHGQCIFPGTQTLASSLNLCSGAVFALPLFGLLLRSSRLSITHDMLLRSSRLPTAWRPVVMAT